MSKGNARTFRRRLSAFQAMRGDPPDPGFAQDLLWLQNRDLDLSVRVGALLAFNALLVTIGTHPVSASPGAPLSLDAATMPWLTAASLAGIAPIAASSWLALRALMVGEEIQQADEEDTRELLRQRLFAAFAHSLDLQSQLLRRGVRWTLAGGAATAGVWRAILWAKVG